MARVRAAADATTCRVPIFPTIHTGENILKIQPPFDRAYLENRRHRNVALARQSRDPAIRALHLEYVRLYEHLLTQEGGATASLS